MGSSATATNSRSKLTAWGQTLAPVLVTAVVLVMLFSGMGLLGAAGFVSAPSPVGLPHAAHGASSASVTPAKITNNLAQREALQNHVVNAVKAAGVPTRDFYPPNFLNSGVQSTGNVLKIHPENDTNPVGLGTIGLDNSTGTPVGTEFNTTSWEGSITLNSANPWMINDDGPNCMGIQLNTVMDNVTIQGDTTASGVFWTQNVAEFCPSSVGMGMLILVDNVWNFSNPSTAEPPSTFYGNNTNHLGYNGTLVSDVYYYDECIPAVGGGCLKTATQSPIQFPWGATLNLWTNATMVPYGSGNFRDAVTFGVTIPGHWSGSYDRVQFNTTLPGAIATPTYLVNSKSLAPVGFLPYDAELIMGGPGGGSSVNLYGINGTMSLNYLSAATSAFTMAPDVWNIGFDTGETAVGISEHYTVPGTAYIQGGPSIPLGFWGSTASGNIGTISVKVTITNPANPWIFLQAGPALTTDYARWAPVQDNALLFWNLTPGTYTGVAEYANYDPMPFTFTGTNGASSTLTINLVPDFTRGVYTPLVAWSSADLAAQMYTGTNTIWNNQNSYLSPLFLQMNDYMFQTFPGAMFVGTATPANLTGPLNFAVNYAQSPYWSGIFTQVGIGSATNELSIQIAYSAFVNVWGMTLNSWEWTSQGSGWPDASVVLWDAELCVVGQNTFGDSSWGLMLMNDTLASGVSTGNTIWGNWFQSTPLAWAVSPLGVFDTESGDHFWNNYFGTLPEAASPSMNVYDGLGQTNTNEWNITGAVPVPSSTAWTVNGFTLTGSLVGAPTVCGNYWVGDVQGSAAPVPYNAGGAIVTGGDYCAQNPSGTATFAITVSETGLAAKDLASGWGATVGTYTLTALTTASASIGGFVSGYFAWSATPMTGYVAVPGSGIVFVNGAPATITVNYVPVTITLTAPVTGASFLAPSYPLYINWTTNWGASYNNLISQDIEVLDADTGAVELSKPISLTGAVTHYSVLPASYLPGCYNVAVGAYNSSTPGVGEPGPDSGIMSWSAVGSAEFCVASASAQPSISGVASQPGGNVSLYWQWNSPDASSASVTVWEGNVPVYGPQNVWSSAGSASGTVVAVLTPATVTSYNIEVSVTTGDSGVVVSNTTFSVAAPVPPVQVSAPTWYNTTSNYYYNSTQTLPGGLAANTLGTILLEIGIVVGAVIGIMIGTMMSRKGKGGMSGGASGTGASSATGGMFTCAACDASFPDQKALDDHRKTVHGM